MKDLLIKIGYALYIVYGQEQGEKILNKLFKIIKS